MLTRRHFFASGAVLAASASIPAFAQEERSNPMPEKLREALERAPNTPVLGNPKGDITLTEFFDYNCPFCRKMVPVLQKLISADDQLRVVFREWAVFGEGSEFAAKASLASLEQGQYWQFHAALMKLRGKVDEASTMRVARKIGLDEDKLREDMEADSVAEHMEMTWALGDHMGLMGTPTFIAGDEAVFGENSLKEMQELVARARKTLG